MLLSGKNLGERHKDLNTKVNDAVKNNVNFDVIKQQKEETDVDILFKIDVAAKYKNTDYILEILKSGDNLYITRALNKCDWLFDDEHSYIRNADYLQNNIFPYMSSKMMKKVLTAISKHVKDEAEAEIFYNYSVEQNLQKIAYKFLYYTSESFKLRIITLYDDNYSELKINFKGRNIKYLLGNSFTLAEAFIEKVDEYKRDKVITDLSYLYFVSNEKYLDLLEKNYKLDFWRLGKKITKDIAIKHKNRILAQLSLYLHKLHTKTLLKYSTIKEIKLYAITKLPQTAKKFWQGRYWNTYKSILDAIPEEERLEFVKEIFTNKYPDEKFETKKEFYTYGCYTIMTKKQREKATENFDSKTGELYKIKRNIWLKNVDFDSAFALFQEKLVHNKKVINKTSLLIVLIKACKSQQDLEKVLNYYIKNYKNKRVKNKEKFLNAILRYHTVMDLEPNCWSILQKIMLDKDVLKLRCYPKKKFECIVYLYHILHEKEFPEDLKTILDTCSVWSFKQGLDKLETEEQVTTVFQYLLQYHVAKLNELEGQDKNYYVMEQSRHHVEFVLHLFTKFKKSKDDYPEIVQKYLRLNCDQFSYYDSMYYENKDVLMRCLKQDADTVKQFETIKANAANNPHFNITALLKKIKVYFSHDIAKEFLFFFKECISEGTDHEEFEKFDELRLFNSAMVGIFILADEKYKSQMMMIFAPGFVIRIDRNRMDRSLLDTQEAICRYAYFSRPPLPITNLMMYVKGDYSKFCLPTIGSLLANLPRPVCLQYLQALMHTQKSVMKYALNSTLSGLKTPSTTKDLEELIMSIWRNTLSVNVRRDLYIIVYELVLNECDKKTQSDLMVFFKEMTMSLREFDDPRCFDVLKDDDFLPDSIKGDLLEAAWESVRQFRSRDTLKKTIIGYIEHYISLMNKDYVRVIVENHIQNSLAENRFGEINLLDKAKWGLVATYLIYFPNDDTNYRTLEFVDIIMINFLDDKRGYNTHKLEEFIAELSEKCTEIRRENYAQANVVLEKIYLLLLKVKSFKSEYFMLWDLKLAMITNKVMDFARSKVADKMDRDGKEIVKEYEFFFAQQLGELVQELTEKDQYQLFVTPQIAEKISNAVEKINLFLNVEDVRVHRFFYILCLVDGLLRLEKHEIHLLALHIICKDFPVDLDTCKEYYLDIFNRFKSCASRDVQHLLNQRFANDGMKKVKRLQ